MIIIESEIDVTSTVKKAKLLCLSRFELNLSDWIKQLMIIF